MMISDDLHSPGNFFPNFFRFVEYGSPKRNLISSTIVLILMNEMKFLHSMVHIKVL